MFYSLRGVITYYDSASVAIECGGVAYQCQTSLSTIGKIGAIGSEAMIYTYLHVREGAIDLFGFIDKAELSCFKMLIAVSGVGPKAALSILSQMSPEGFALSVASGDYKSLTSAPGIGAKLAQRIVLELKDKVSSADVARGISMPSNIGAGLISGNAGEAVSALVVLGYTHTEAAAAIASMPPGTSVEEMIKAGLKTLALSAR